MRVLGWRLSVIVVAALSLLGGAVMVAVSASAGPVPLACGTVIVANTTLAADVGPCSTDGVIIGASNITLNLAGHKILGNSQPAAGSVGVHVVPQQPGSVIVTGVVIKGGTVSGFSAGVVLDSGYGDTVQNMTVTGNVGSGTGEFGDGIVLVGSNKDLVQHNTVTGNGPFDGIGLVAGASSNQILGNTITGNNLVRGGSTSTSEDDGVRLEDGSVVNTVSGNTIKGNGNDGVAVFPASSDNAVLNNTISGNGFHSASVSRLGDGIHVFVAADRSLVSGNTVSGNARYGIAVESAGDQVLANTAASNATSDLFDYNANCGTNTWSANHATPGDPACTQN